MKFKIKPCPFCGGNTEVYNRFGDVFITCYKCHARVSFSDCETDQNQTLEKWDARVKEGSENNENN